MADEVRRHKAEELTTEGKPKAVAKYSLGFTVNIKNYESCKIEAGVEIEGTVDNLDRLQELAQAEVEEEVFAQLEELKSKNPNESMLGFKS